MRQKEVRITHEDADVLIIGTGGAGLRCAIELSDNNVDVLLVGKCEQRDAHTVLATGGINAALGVMDKQDTWQMHAADTIRDGGFLNDTKSVMTLCKEAPTAVKELARWGTRFHREKNKKISQRFFGAARYRRACFVGDTTGKEILNVLVNQTIKRKIPTKNMVYIVSLLTTNNRVMGALGLNIKTGALIIFHAKVVVLATGGHSRIYRRSSSRFWENTGDGIALATEVGAQCMDMELFQFHPTGMLAPKAAEGTLVTEAVRGEGGVLRNSKGERFMKRYDPERQELSARDVVARAIYTEIKKGRGTKRGGVFLDISHKSLAHIRQRLPRMYKQFKDFQHLDISKQAMEVGPTAHYSMGGLVVNHSTGKTTVSGLYAIGEVTAGIHGGNRLGGNSLAEITVFGRLVGKHLAKTIKKQQLPRLHKQSVFKAIHRFLTFAQSTTGKNPRTVKEDIQSLMWNNVGVVRTGKQMERAQQQLHKYDNNSLKIGGSLKMNERLINALDVVNIIPTCHMVVASALRRKESRAAHYRTDYPKTVTSWKKNIICTPTPKGFILKTRAVPAIPQSIAKLIKNKDHSLSTVLLE